MLSSALGSKTTAAPFAPRSPAPQGQISCRPTLNDRRGSNRRMESRATELDRTARAVVSPSGWFIKNARFRSRNGAGNSDFTGADQARGLQPTSRSSNFGRIVKRGSTRRNIRGGLVSNRRAAHDAAASQPRRMLSYRQLRCALDLLHRKGRTDVVDGGAFDQ